MTYQGKKMKFAYKIDWLTMTFKHTSKGRSTLTDLKELQEMMLDLAQDLGLWGSDYEVKSANRFYDVAITFKQSNITLSGSFAIEKQGFMVVATGRSFSDNEEAVLWLEQAINGGWKPTRIDLALDLFDSGISVDDVAVSYNYQHHLNMQKKTQFIHSSHGDSFYIGSRHSEKMLRVYDKGGEQGLDVDWVRYEMELKGEAATGVVPHILRNFKQTAMLHVAMLSIPDSDIGTILENFAQGEKIKLVKSPSTKEGREKWLFTVVAPVLAKMREDDYEKYEIFQNYVLDMYDDYVKRKQ